MPDDDNNSDEVLVYLHFDSDDFSDYLTSHYLFQKPKPPARDAQSAARAAKAEPASPGKRKTLRLWFRRDRPKGKNGLLIGSSSSCHIMLNHPFIAKFHGTLTFDEHHCLVYRDLGSRHGSSVTYQPGGSEENSEVGSDLSDRRRDFTWVVGGPDVPGGVVICLGGKYSISLTVPSRDWTSAGHQRYVDRFLAATRGDVKDRQLQNEMNSELVRPGPARHKNPALQTRPLFLPASLGRVAGEWNVSTARFRVVKSVKYSERQELKNWGKEVLIWNDLKHASHPLSVLAPPNITQCLEVNLTVFNLFLRPSLALHEGVTPSIYLEYAPYGSLEHLESSLQYEQAVSVTYQCLDALTYMHERNLAHRSIKPSNILISALDPIRVKLTDFGAATVSDRCASIRGSAPWFAPEMHAAIDANGNRKRRGANGEKITFDSNGKRAARKMKPLEYGAAVDIWALGVVAMDLAWPGNLPGPGAHSPAAPRWKLICDALATSLSKAIAKSRWLTFIKNKMLVSGPSERRSARACLQEVEALHRPSVRKEGPVKDAAPKPPDRQPPAEACLREAEAAQGRSAGPVKEAASNPPDRQSSAEACLQEVEVLQGQSEPKTMPVKGTAVSEPSENYVAGASGAGTGEPEAVVVTVAEQPPAPPAITLHYKVDWEGDLVMTGMAFSTITLSWMVDGDGDVLMTDAPRPG
ncbi:protein kinase [Cordyceps fumosorosea ARSEF 2679]|uniref:Protein kinase n=1 Tax=Cordyceps fumosorosea (strain ARSEF 2679) TaxID=1081104 RepID=A0A167R1I5_CORFA|nr:protein kinase [Cordyceps fumosorosea ARSEF 2679]OAA58182.1 protein kinase [Cordyceps fumosorosea ARSEF 2679]